MQQHDNGKPVHVLLPGNTESDSQLCRSLNNALLCNN